MKPVCRVCGERHWSREEHIWAKEDVVEKAEEDLKRKQLVTSVLPTTLVSNAPLSNAERQRRWRESHREVHRQRSRDAMRKRRAVSV